MTPGRKRRPKAWTIVIGAAALAAVLAGAAWYLHRGTGSPRADASDPELVALGAAVYRVLCQFP